MEEELEIKKKKIKETLSRIFKDKYLVLLFILITLSLVINLYFFVITKNQTVWWDEAEYLSTASKWVKGVPYNINSQRPPLYPLLESIPMFLGLPDLTSKFLFTLIPGVLLPIFVFLLGKKLFNKETGIIAAFFISIFWSLIFWNARYQPDQLSITFQLLSIYFFYTSFVEGKVKQSYFVGLFAALAFLLKNSALITLAGLALFGLIYFRFSLFKKKQVYFAILSFFIIILPYLIWQYFYFGSALAFSTGATAPLEEKFPFNWQAFSFIVGLIKFPITFLYIIGILLLLFNIILSYDLIIKRDKKYAPSALILIFLLWIYVFFVFIQRLNEDRWYLILMPFIFILSSQAILFISSYIKKYSKYIAIFFILAILAYSAYIQVSAANSAITSKIDSYSQVKDASLYLKSLTQKEDIIMTLSYTQATYYSERRVKSFSQMNESQFIDYVQTNKPKYMFVSVFEPWHPEWSLNMPEYLQEFLEPVKVYQMNNQTSLVIFKIHADKLPKD